MRVLAWVTAAASLGAAVGRIGGGGALSELGDEERRALSRRGLSPTGDRWLLSVPTLEAGSQKCVDLERNLTNACRPFLRIAGSDADSGVTEFDDVCIVNFVCSLAVINSGALDAWIDTADLEHNVEMFAEAASSWGLDRIDQGSLPLDKSFSSRYDGSGVNIYVVDTGTSGDHDEFAGRYTQGADFVRENDSGFDMNGHGTHCAGTAAGATYGVATGAQVFGVKVLSARGAGDTSDVVKGVQYAVNNQRKKFGGQAAVISLSLGGGANSAMDNAVRAAARAGHIVVVAAGNQNDDACNYSPARMGGSGRGASAGVISVMSSDKRDRRSGFSNYGKCTDIIAPGTDIKSAWTGGRSKVNVISGTSMATPHVAGVAATLLQKHAFDKTSAQAELFSAAVADKIKDAKSGSDNLLLQVASSYEGPPTKAPTMGPTFKPPTFCAGALCPTLKFSRFGPALPEGPQREHHVIVAEDVYADATGCRRFGRDLRIVDSIVVVLRGDCEFITKVQNAQRAGAAGVLIEQNSNAVPFEPETNSGEVSIMSAMISRADARKLKDAVRKENRKVLMGAPP